MHQSVIWCQLVSHYYHPTALQDTHLAHIGAHLQNLRRRGAHRKVAAPALHLLDGFLRIRLSTESSSFKIAR